MQGVHFVEPMKYIQPSTLNIQRSSSFIRSVKSSDAKIATNTSARLVQPQFAATSWVKKPLLSGVIESRAMALNQTAAEKADFHLPPYLPPYGILSISDLNANSKFWRSPSSDYFSNFMLGYQTHKARGLHHYVENLSNFYKNFTPDSVLAYQLFPTKEDILHPDCSHPACAHPDCAIVTKQTQLDFINNPLLPSAHRKVLDLALATFGLRRVGNKIHALAEFKIHSPSWAKPENTAKRGLLLQMVKSLNLLENQLVAKNLCHTVATLLKQWGLHAEAEQFFALNDTNKSNANKSDANKSDTNKSDANKTESTQTVQPKEKPASPVNLQVVELAKEPKAPLTAADKSISIVDTFAKEITLPPCTIKKSNSFNRLIRRRSSILKYSIKHLDRRDANEYPDLLKKQQRILEGCLEENSSFSFLNEEMFAKYNELSHDLVLISVATRNVRSLAKQKEKVSLMLLTLKKQHEKEFIKAEIIHKNNEKLETYDSILNTWHQPQELDLFCQEDFRKFDAMEMTITNFNNALNESDENEFNCGKNKALLEKVTDSFLQLKNKHREEYEKARISYRNNEILASYERLLTIWHRPKGLCLFQQDVFNEFNAMKAKIKHFNGALNKSDQGEFDCGRGQILLSRVTHSFAQLKSKYESEYAKAWQQFSTAKRA